MEPTRRFWAGRVRASVVTLTLLALVSAGLAYWAQRSPPFANDPGLIETKAPTGGILFTPMTFLQRLQWTYYELKKKYFPNPLTYSFGAASPSPCSVHGLLNQCMDAGGMRYFIEKNVAAGSVNFGHTNVLNGEQWIRAFESALETNTPAWWDPERKGFRHENLVLLRYGRRMTLVLPEAKAKEYEEKYPGLARVNPAAGADGSGRAPKANPKSEARNPKPAR